MFSMSSVYARMDRPRELGVAAHPVAVAPDVDDVAAVQHLGGGLIRAVPSFPFFLNLYSERSRKTPLKHRYAHERSFSQLLGDSPDPAGGQSKPLRQGLHNGLPLGPRHPFPAYPPDLHPDVLVSLPEVLQRPLAGVAVVALHDPPPLRLGTVVVGLKPGAVRTAPGPCGDRLCGDAHLRVRKGGPETARSRSSPAPGTAASTPPGRVPCPAGRPRSATRRRASRCARPWRPPRGSGIAWAGVVAVRPRCAAPAPRPPGRTAPAEAARGASPPARRPEARPRCRAAAHRPGAPG